MNRGVLLRRAVVLHAMILGAMILGAMILGAMILGAMILGALMLGALPAAAEAPDDNTWPAHPVRIVNGFAAGGAADILARMAADQLTKTFGQQFFVETRAGASGVISVDDVAHSPPDGYNFVLTTLSLTAIGPLVNSKIGYDPFKDLTHVAYLAGSPIVFIVNAKSEVKTLGDFVAKAKSSLKPLTYGVSGLASAGQMLAESFAQLADLQFQVVPYKGASQSQLDVVAGNIDFATPTVTSATPQLQGGTVTALAQTGAKRLPDYPNMPTFKELGYDIVAANWFGLAGPAGLPPDIVRKVNRAINAGMAAPESQERIRVQGMIIAPMDAATFQAFVEHEALRWKPVILKAGLKME
ncbi:MAG: tripartite tricarboxylate transporter substrate binding protein [Xanthobacteraceae bacterium]|jgi:tripartite-type tricarboxylate transporter receptor subunit TctC